MRPPPDKQLSVLVRRKLERLPSEDILAGQIIVSAGEKRVGNVMRREEPGFSTDVEGQAATQDVFGGVEKHLSGLTTGSSAAGRTHSGPGSAERTVNPHTLPVRCNAWLGRMRTTRQVRPGHEQNPRRSGA